MKHFVVSNQPKALGFWISKIQISDRGSTVLFGTTLVVRLVLMSKNADAANLRIEEVARADL